MANQKYPGIGVVSSRERGNCFAVAVLLHPSAGHCEFARRLFVVFAEAKWVPSSACQGNPMPLLEPASGLEPLTC